ncbi:MAG: hypothetical protein M1597_01815 [Candidatus Thermoplasmatota archaeon]|nr:hypothetical protein [Candidatus Thermoplasmatota archaeon]
MMRKGRSHEIIVSESQVEDIDKVAKLYAEREIVRWRVLPFRKKSIRVYLKDGRKISVNPIIQFKEGEPMRKGITFTYSPEKNEILEEVQE